jgi:hypothetical protein
MDPTLSLHEVVAAGLRQEGAFRRAGGRGRGERRLAMGRLASVRWGRPGVLAARRAAVAAAPAPGISGRSLMRFCGRSKPENSSRLMPSGRRQSDGRRHRRWRCDGGPDSRCAWSLLYGWRVLTGGRGVLLRLRCPGARCDQCCYSHRDPRRAALGFCLNRAAPPARRRRPRSV